MREKGESADDHDGARSSKPANSPPVTGKVPADSGTDFFLCEISRDGEHRNNHEEAAKQLSHRSCGVVPHGVRVQARERRPIIAGRRSVSVERLETSHEVRGLEILDVPKNFTTETAENTRIVNVRISTASMAIFTS